MKKWGAILLVFLLLLNIFNNATIFVLYKINQAKITELFCINKDKPELQCNGKCHLKEVIKEQQKEKKELPFSTNLETRQVVLLFVQQLSTIEIHPIKEKKSHHFYYNFSLKEYLSRPDILPPKA